jgi:MraZ protein
MGHFLGTHQGRLDAKGRVSVPAPFRAALRVASEAGLSASREAALAARDETLAMILRPSHQRNCIEVWPAAAFHALAPSLARYDIFSDTQDDLATALYSDAQELAADKEGRIVLPQSLLDHAGITDTMEFMGIGPIFQIWHPDAARARREAARAAALSKRLTIPANGVAPNATAPA